MVDEQLAALPPAGWYPDQADGGLERWWDGQNWRDLHRPILTRHLQRHPYITDPARRHQKFLPKTRKLGKAVALIQIAWMFTLGLIIVIMLILISMDSSTKTPEEQLTHDVLAAFTLCAISAPFLLLLGLGKRQSRSLVVAGGLAGGSAAGLALVFFAREDIAIRPILPIAVFFAVAYVAPAIEAAVTLRRQDSNTSAQATYH